MGRCQSPRSNSSLWEMMLEKGTLPICLRIPQARVCLLNFPPEREIGDPGCSSKKGLVGFEGQPTGVTSFDLYAPSMKPEA